MFFWKTIVLGLSGLCTKIESMAAGTGFSQSYVMVEDGFNNDISTEGEEKSQNSDQLNQLNVGKPPRHLSVVRHSISTATLLTPTDPVYKIFPCLKLIKHLMLCRSLFLLMVLFVN